MAELLCVDRYSRSSSMRKSKNHVELGRKPHPTEAKTGKDRRAFLRGSAVVASAVAAGSLSALTADTAAAADPSPQPNLPRPKDAITGRFAKQPGLEDVQRLVAQLVDKGGCRTCGLVGFDVRLGLQFQRIPAAVKTLPTDIADVAVFRERR
jgi:hypothetical protein